ncbi:RHS repeat-associated core domain-containing protein [Frateuria sp. Soil773]|uniref:RHS repeat-associated core domain-containing protein n=1 Tax=Frateuria sp. Soil773 TaxID=1736407 RepID=UPI0009EB7C67|nr:RHS repeat-associated core domain-containing protein [Frateuria sp. Soil773]
MHSSGPGYTGHMNDPDTGLVYMQARFYDSSTGRFLNVDPEPMKVGDLYGAERYGYANNNPLRYTDPDGRYACGSSNQSTCAKIDKFVGAMNKGLANLKKGSGQYKALSAVSAHIGKPGTIMVSRLMRGRSRPA